MLLKRGRLRPGWVHDGRHCDPPRCIAAGVGACHAAEVGSVRDTGCWLAQLCVVCWAVCGYGRLPLVGGVEESAAGTEQVDHTKAAA
jgi:hypothetical protein